MSHPPLLAAVGLSCTLTIGAPGCLARVTVCRTASLLVRAGEIAVVAGPRGAGRTTLLQCLAGMRAPCAGHVRWGDRPPLRVWRGIAALAAERTPVRALGEPRPGGARGALLVVDDERWTTPADAPATVLRDRARAGDAVVWGVRAASREEARDVVGPDVMLYWLADGWLRSR